MFYYMLNSPPSPPFFYYYSAQLYTVVQIDGPFPLSKSLLDTFSFVTFICLVGDEMRDER